MLNEINLVPTTKKIVALTKKNGKKNINELFFNAIQDCNVEVLAEIILAFSEDAKGNAKFKDTDAVYDFIDGIRKEHGYKAIFREVGKVINEMGFFVAKMTEEELEKEMDSPYMNLNIGAMVEKATEKVVTEVFHEEFRGYKA